MICFRRPPDVAGLLVTVVAGVGVVVNLAAAGCWRKPIARAWNVEGSFQHILTDLRVHRHVVAGSTCSLFDRADAIASLFVAVLMIRSALSLQRRAIAAAEGAPESMASRRSAGDGRHRHVSEVHDLHGAGARPSGLTAHVSSPRARTATPSGGTLKRCSSSASTSAIRRCKWITRTSRSSRSPRARRPRRA